MSSLSMFFDAISSNIDEGLSINPSVNVFVFSVKLKGNTQFHHITNDCSRADWDGLRHHLRNVLWEDIFKLGASAASEFL